MFRFCLTLYVLIILSLSGGVEAKRVALIVGNAQYENTSTLANPANDAEVVAASARKAGFDDVTVAQNLSIKEFQGALRDFRTKANGADVAMVYYAGHGIEGQGKNWLIPVDAELNADLDLPYEALNLDRVVEAVSGAQIRMVVLDACRNNPFAGTWKSETRSLARGLAGIDADDILVIYAAAPGQTAVDGDGNNSPFASSFANRLPQAGLPVQLLGGMVRDDVLTATGGAQRPFVSASITGTPVYLVEAVSGAERPDFAETSEIISLNESALDALAWEGALNADTVAAYRSYLDSFPAGDFATLASENIASQINPTNADGSIKKPAGLLNAFLPDHYAVDQTGALPIDGMWTISTIKKRIRIEKGRAYAVDGWTHGFVLKILPDMVILTDIKRNKVGKYVANDLPLTAKAELKLQSDGNIRVKAKTFPFPIEYTLVRETLDSLEAMEAEQAQLALEK